MGLGAGLSHHTPAVCAQWFYGVLVNYINVI